jgi:hypothetical protein
MSDRLPGVRQLSRDRRGHRSSGQEDKRAGMARRRHEQPAQGMTTSWSLRDRGAMSQEQFGVRSNHRKTVTRSIYRILTRAQNSQELPPIRTLPGILPDFFLEPRRC